MQLFCPPHPKQASIHMMSTCLMLCWRLLYRPSGSSRPSKYVFPFHNKRLYLCREDLLQQWNLPLYLGPVSKLHLFGKSSASLTPAKKNAKTLVIVSEQESLWVSRWLYTFSKTNKQTNLLINFFGLRGHFPRGNQNGISTPLSLYLSERDRCNLCHAYMHGVLHDIM